MISRSFHGRLCRGRGRTHRFDTLEQLTTVRSNSYEQRFGKALLGEARALGGQRRVLQALAIARVMQVGRTFVSSRTVSAVAGGKRRSAVSRAQINSSSMPGRNLGRGSLDLAETAGRRRALHAIAAQRSVTRRLFFRPEQAPLREAR